MIGNAGAAGAFAPGVRKHLHGLSRIIRLKQGCAEGVQVMPIQRLQLYRPLREYNGLRRIVSR